MGVKLNSLGNQTVRRWDCRLIAIPTTTQNVRDESSLLNLDTATTAMANTKNTKQAKGKAHAKNTPKGSPSTTSTPSDPHLLHANGTLFVKYTDNQGETTSRKRGIDPTPEPLQPSLKRLITQEDTQEPQEELTRKKALLMYLIFTFFD